MSTDLSVTQAANARSAASTDLSVTQAANARSAAIAELLDALDELSASYRGLPESERVDRCTEDADRITAEVARHLFTARTRLSSAYGRRHG
ncbi:hypothetical protein [Pseudonocardia pini]|uniref:hypothetical protein n=1 Tax=Pseudonocardia pini TaxID=2758030 RepID=UPI0015F0505A|nr:hypothetical protein [Pseudonocardia pini]